MDLIDTECDDTSYFTCGHEVAPLTACHLDINLFKGIQHLLNQIQLLKKSFNTEGQWQNISWQSIDISTIINITI